MNKIKYIISLTFAAAITVVCFALFFLFGENKLLGNAFVEASGATPNNSQTELKIQSGDQAELSELIDKYKSYLSSKYLRVINEENPITDEIKSEYELKRLGADSNITLEQEAAGKLDEFLAAAKADGVSCAVISGYISEEAQQELYDAEYSKNIAAGYTDESIITAKTKRAVALPEYCENCIGLAVDLGQTKSTVSVSEAEKSAFYEYATSNIYKYGFILRYPKDKESVTGFDFNPWHFRYIGDAKQAKYITEKNISLEEYVDYLKTQISISENRIGQ